MDRGAAQPRPAELTVLNEPEASLHPDLIPALAGLIARAAQRSQLVIVTHSEALVRALGAIADDLGLLRLARTTARP